MKGSAGRRVLWGGSTGNSRCKGTVLGGRQTRLGTQEDESTWAEVGRDEEETRTGQEGWARGRRGMSHSGCCTVKALVPAVSSCYLGRKHPKRCLL